MLTRYVQHKLTWIDLVAPSSSEVRQVMEEFTIDPAFAQELLCASYKPKVERGGDAIFLILHFPAPRGAGRPQQEIDFIIGKNFLITTRYENVGPLHTFAKAFEVDSVLGRPGAAHGGHLFVAMAETLYGALVSECHSLRRTLEDIEERIFKGDERGMVIVLSQVGRVIHDFRQALIPHKEMLSSLEPVAARLFGPEFSYYVRNVEGAFGRVEQTLTNLRDSLFEMRETNNSLLSTKQNEIMRTFTVLAFIFLPLSFVAGLFGMNTEHNPIAGSPGDFWVVFGMMVALAVGFFVFFKRKGWL